MKQKKQGEPDSMHLQPLKQLQHLQHSRASLSLYLKTGAILLLFALSVLIVACSSTTPTNTDLGNPQVTVTINLNQNALSPTPTLPPYTCGAWVTNTTPAFNTTSVVEVYAKFIHNVDENPVGVDNASATATVLWPDGSTNTVTATTTSDGLAVFPVAIKSQAEAIGKLVLVTVTFTGPDGTSCTVGQDQAAYFTLVVVSPTATHGPAPTATGTTGGTPGPTPTGPPNPKKTPPPHH
jgi:hypothetical protein